MEDGGRKGLAQIAGAVRAAKKAAANIAFGNALAVKLGPEDVQVYLRAVAEKFDIAFPTSEGRQ